MVLRTWQLRPTSGPGLQSAHVKAPTATSRLHSHSPRHRLGTRVSAPDRKATREQEAGGAGSLAESHGIVRRYPIDDDHHTTRALASTKQSTMVSFISLWAGGLGGLRSH
jgi:hypothetical protein